MPGNTSGLRSQERRAALFSLALLSLQIPAGLFPTQFFTSDHSETHTEQKKRKNKQTNKQTWRPIKVPEYSRALASLTLLPSTPVLSPPLSSGWFCRRSLLPPESDPSKCHGLKGSLVRVMLVSTWVPSLMDTDFPGRDVLSRRQTWGGKRHLLLTLNTEDFTTQGLEKHFR